MGEQKRLTAEGASLLLFIQDTGSLGPQGRERTDLRH